MGTKKTINRGQLKLLPTSSVDDILDLYEELLMVNSTYGKRYSIRAGRKLRKVLLRLQKACTTARAEVLHRRFLKKPGLHAYEEELPVAVDPNQTSLALS